MKKDDKKELNKLIEKGIKEHKPTTKKEKVKLKRQYKTRSNRHKSVSLKLYHAKKRLKNSKHFFEQENIRKDIIKLSQKKGDLFKDKRELKNKIENKYTISTNNVDININYNYLKSLKNPAKYIERIYEQKTQTQILNLTDSGDIGQAIGLLKLLEKTHPENIDTNLLLSAIENAAPSEFDDELEQAGDYIDDVESGLQKTYDIIIQDGDEFKITFI